MDTKIRKRVTSNSTNNVDSEERGPEPPTKQARIWVAKTRETFSEELPTQLVQDEHMRVRFDLSKQSEPVAEDPSIEHTRKKQLRLLTIHKKLGHRSFSILK